MRLIVHGQQAFGQAVFERLIQQNENVVAVYCAPDKGDRPDPLKQSAIDAGISVYQPTSYKQPEVAETMGKLNADLCLMAYVTLFVPSAVLNTPKLGSIQFHPSLLPDHKGPSSINWPIIQGKTKTGLTIFWPDDGLDTGPILLQKEVEIGADDTLGSLYFNKIFPLGVDAMLEALKMVKTGNATSIPQDPKAGSYESWCGQSDAKIDWSRDIDDVYNLIRGTNPQPGAWTVFNGRKIKIFDCHKSAAIRGTPGSVIEISDDGINVATANGEVVIKRVRDTAGKISALEFVEQSGLKCGDIFSD